jgi:hypothetical protein
MTPADLRRWIRDSRAAQDLPAAPTAEEVARIVAAVGTRAPKAGKAGTR